MAKAIPISQVEPGEPAPAAEILAAPVANPTGPRAVPVDPSELAAMAAELGGVVAGNAVRVDH